MATKRFLRFLRFLDTVFCICGLLVIVAAWIAFGIMFIADAERNRQSVKRCDGGFCYWMTYEQVIEERRKIEKVRARYIEAGFQIPDSLKVVE